MASLFQLELGRVLTVTVDCLVAISQRLVELPGHFSQERWPSVREFLSPFLGFYLGGLRLLEGVDLSGEALNGRVIPTGVSKLLVVEVRRDTDGGQLGADLIDLPIQHVGNLVVTSLLFIELSVEYSGQLAMEAFYLTQCHDVRVREENAKFVDFLGVDFWGTATGSWRGLGFRTVCFERVVLSSPGCLWPGRMDDHEEVFEAHA